MITTDEKIYQQIVNDPFKDKVQAAKLGLGIVVLLIVNKETAMIDRVALSETEQAEGAVKVSVKPFKLIRIPLENQDNIIAKAIRSGTYQITDDWKYLFVPALRTREARLNQASAGIACSYVYPLNITDGGALIFSFFIPPQDFTQAHYDFMKDYAAAVSAKLKSG